MTTVRRNNYGMKLRLLESTNVREVAEGATVPKAQVFNILKQSGCQVKWDGESYFIYYGLWIIKFS